MQNLTSVYNRFIINIIMRNSLRMDRKMMISSKWKHQ